MVSLHNGSERLPALSAAGGVDIVIGDIRLSEVDAPALLWLAVAPAKEHAAARSVRQAWGCQLPRPLAFTSGESAALGAVRLLWCAPHQYMVMFARYHERAQELAGGELGDGVYLTDQSDNWVMIRLSGATVVRALQRLCMLDLRSSSFGVGAVARTLMDHLHVIIARVEPDCFLLLSPRSSAQSFVHGVEGALRNLG